MFPPGRARLATNPLATGSLSLVMTMGIVTVAALAGRVADGPAVTMTSTLRRTSSAASEGRRSSCPSADRHSMTMVFPLHVPQLAQALPECLGAGRHHGQGDSREESYPGDLRWLLRLGGERRGEEGEDQASARGGRCPLRSWATSELAGCYAGGSGGSTAKVGSSLTFNPAARFEEHSRAHVNLPFARRSSPGLDQRERGTPTARLSDLGLGPLPKFLKFRPADEP